MRRFFYAFISALTLSAGAVLPAVAQETPAVEPGAAAHCTVEPIDPVVYNAAILKSIPPEPAPTSPQGEPADKATVDAVTDTISQSVACTSAGDLGRLLAVIDPSYAPTLLGVPYGDVPGAVEAAAQSSESSAPATPLVDDVDQASLVSTLKDVSNVIVLSNGQVAADATIKRAGYPTSVATIYLKQDEDSGRYIIVNYAFHKGEAPVATPVA